MAQIQNKESYIKDLFGRIAGKYDSLNDMMTFFLHNRWKSDVVKTCNSHINYAQEQTVVLDLCTGTGDMAFLWAQTSVDHIVGIDSCAPMLQVAAAKKSQKNLDSNIEFIEADALELPFDDASFDAVTVGFGLRNVADLDSAIQEIKRVLKPGGVIASLDLGHPPNPIVDAIYRGFFLKTIPALGSSFAKDKRAYQYLVDSLETWPSQKALCQKFYDHGFSRSYFQDIMLGAVAIVAAEK